MKKLGVVFAFVFVVILSGAAFLKYTAGMSRAAVLEQQALIVGQECVIGYDKIWKTVQEKGGVVKDREPLFKKIFPTLIGERYEEEGQEKLSKFVTDYNPTFDKDSMVDIFVAIELDRHYVIQKHGFLKKISKEHAELRATNWFVSSRDEIKMVF